MLNYILADYKRVIRRFPRIVALVIFEAIFAYIVLDKWSKASGNYTSVTIMEDSDFIFAFLFTHVMCVVDFVHSFSFDFNAKTIQVALGLGISRMQVILSKLIQTTLVIITDLLVTYGVFGILCAITGTSLAGHQIAYLAYNGFGCVLLASLSVCLILPLVFRIQNMPMSMIGCFALILGIPSMIMRWITRLGPVFLARLELDRLTHDSCAAIVVSNAVSDNFQLMPVIGVFIWYAVGIYLTWLFFRKMELDF